MFEFITSAPLWVGLLASGQMVLGGLLGLWLLPAAGDSLSRS